MNQTALANCSAELALCRNELAKYKPEPRRRIKLEQPRSLLRPTRADERRLLEKDKRLLQEELARVQTRLFRKKSGELQKLNVLEHSCKQIAAQLGSQSADLNTILARITYLQRANEEKDILIAQQDKEIYDQKRRIEVLTATPLTSTTPSSTVSSSPSTLISDSIKSHLMNLTESHKEDDWLTFLEKFEDYVEEAKSEMAKCAQIQQFVTEKETELRQREDLLTKKNQQLNRKEERLWSESKEHTELVKQVKECQDTTQENHELLIFLNKVNGFMDLLYNVFELGELPEEKSITNPITSTATPTTVQQTVQTATNNLQQTTKLLIADEKREILENLVRDAQFIGWTKDKRLESIFDQQVDRTVQRELKEQREKHNVLLTKEVTATYKAILRILNSIEPLDVKSEQLKTDNDPKILLPRIVTQAKRIQKLYNETLSGEGFCSHCSDRQITKNLLKRIAPYLGSEQKSFAGLLDVLENLNQRYAAIATVGENMPAQGLPSLTNSLRLLEERLRIARREEENAVQKKSRWSV